VEKLFGQFNRLIDGTFGGDIIKVEIPTPPFSESVYRYRQAVNFPVVDVFPG
jgi:hypothetical protein